MRKSSTIALLLAGTLAMGSASATVIQGTSLQNQLTGAGAIINVQTDQYNPDERWQVGATGFGGVRLLFELAGFANENSFGIYDVTNSLNRLTIFSGPNGVGSRGSLSNEGTEFCAGLAWGAPTCSNFGSSLFGFFLSTPNGTFFSEAHLNSDEIDHMVAFEGGPGRGHLNGRPWLASEFILAWEDLLGGGDRDYDDFGVLVAPIIAVLEPTSLALLGIGLVVMFAMRRRRIRARL